MAEKSRSPDDPRVDLAEDRTDLAEDRSILANQRTYAAWVRTGLAALAVGVAFERIFDNVTPTWAAKAIATLFLISSVIVFALGYQQFRSNQPRIENHEVQKLPVASIRILTALAILGTILAGAAVWLL